MLYFPTQHDISTFTSSSAGNEIGTPLLGFGHQKQHRGMITSQKGLTSLYQLRCIQKSPHEYARNRQFIRTTSLKSLKRLQAPTTTSDLYLGRLLSSATIFFPPFCNRCSSNSYSTSTATNTWNLSCLKYDDRNSTRTNEARKWAIKKTFLLTYLLLDARRQRVRRYRRTTQTAAGRQSGRKAGSKKSDTKLTFSGFKLGEEILDRNSNRLFLNREESVTSRESHNKRRNSHKSEQKSRKEQHHSFQIARKHGARDTATSALHLFYFVAPSRASTNPLATFLLTTY
jgi:hypothetical protein